VRRNLLRSLGKSTRECPVLSLHTHFRTSRCTGLESITIRWQQRANSHSLFSIHYTIIPPTVIDSLLWFQSFSYFVHVPVDVQGTQPLSLFSVSFFFHLLTALHPRGSHFWFLCWRQAISRKFDFTFSPTSIFWLLSSPLPPSFAHFIWTFFGSLEPHGRLALPLYCLLFRFTSVTSSYFRLGRTTRHLTNLRWG
jgi:hypothetical protein